MTAGTQTRTLNRFTFDDDGNSEDDFSLGFDAAWDTNGVGVGAISILETSWQTIRFRDNNPFSATALLKRKRLC